MLPKDMRGGVGEGGGDPRQPDLPSAQFQVCASASTSAAGLPRLRLRLRLCLIVCIDS